MELKEIKLLTIIETLGKGGAERVLVNTLPELKRLGIHCEVATLFNDNDLAEELEYKGIKVHRLNLSYKWNIFEGISKLNKLIKKNNYNILHAHLFFAYFYTGLIKYFNKDIKTVTTFHNLGYDEYPANTLIKKVRKVMDRKIVTSLFDKTTAVSHAVKKHYEKHFYLDDIDVIMNSFPIDEFKEYRENKSNSILQKYLKINDSDYIVLTPGRFVEKKGHKYLIDAIEVLNKKYKNFIFLFIGKGPLEDSLKEKAPSNLHFISAVSHHELMKIYNKVDLIVIPSIYEAFGLVVGEAMIMEKSIIATNVDGINEMIENEQDGLLVPAKDSLALANSIEKIYQNKSIGEYLAKNAREKIKNFDTKFIANKWKDYYERMLD